MNAANIDTLVGLAFIVLPWAWMAVHVWRTERGLTRSGDRG